MIKVTSDKPSDEPEVDEYPMLMKDERLGVVIYAIRENAGCRTVSGVLLISGSSVFNPGVYIEHWDKSILTPYTGKLTLENVR